MKVDSIGNVYVAGSVGVAIYSPDGELLDEIHVPGSVTNLTWGGTEGKILFVCSFNDLY